MRANPPLARRLTTTDAVVIGLGSMIGAGVFVVFAPAAAVAGTWLLLGVALAAVVAYCNATSSAQLAAQYPTSGGTYVYGRERLGSWWGYLAGWAFVVGKTASCAAMALVLAAYLVPVGWQRPVAVAAVLGVAGANLRGVTRTARLTRLLVGIVLGVLGLVVAAGVVAATRHPLAPLLADGSHGVGIYGVLQAGGLLFFAFAGYARIATLGEEVIAPRRTIPCAVVIALGLTVVLYLVVATATLLALGPERLAASAAPLADVVQVIGWSWAAPVVVVGSAAGALGALLALVAGIGRTTLAMARNGDLPSPLAAVSDRFHVPHRAEIAVALVVVVLVLTVDLRGAIGFSSFGVLVYYLIANIAAHTQSGEHRRHPRCLHWLGAVGCVVLAVTLPWQSVVGGVAVLAVGVGHRLLASRLTRAARTRLSHRAA
ncbi:APC family permease [Pseudonocardia sp. N23]|uniref:APC family permease n=1 Tax=Pseudonocardia sp. N23 TaxID=1987376 RepID=UPI000BFCFE49|nr:APC family permease [Pseudonocardia sp. N23]GAY12913.1 putative amino acid transporter [Pseudonocardia sp. N23]